MARYTVARVGNEVVVHLMAFAASTL